MKYLNKVFVLLLLCISFNSCQQEEILTNEQPTFKSIDQLATDARFVDFLSGELSFQSEKRDLERAEFLINQERITEQEKTEVAQIMGYADWASYQSNLEHKREIVSTLNQEYNLSAYEPEVIADYGEQALEWAYENKMDAIPALPGPVVIDDPCGCDALLLACVLVVTGVSIGAILQCYGLPDGAQQLCLAVVDVGNNVAINACLIAYGICVANCE